MEKNTTLNKWLSTMERNLNDSSLFNMDFSSKENIRIMEEDFISLFNSIIEGETYKIISLTKSSSSESYDINQYRKSDQYTGKELFTNLDQEEQKEAMSKLFLRSQNNLTHKSVSNSYL